MFPKMLFWGMFSNIATIEFLLLDSLSSLMQSPIFRLNFSATLLLIAILFSLSIPSNEPLMALKLNKSRAFIVMPQ